MRDVADEAQVRAWLAAEPAPDPDDVVELLDETNPIYDGLGSPAVVRLRGALLLALAGSPLTDRALPFVLEELETPHDAYLTAAAAHTLRAAAMPDARFAAPLLTALEYFRSRDDMVRLSAYGGYGGDGEPTTAATELLRTLSWMGPHASDVRAYLEHLRDESAGRRAALLDDAIAQIASGPAPSVSCCGTAVSSDSLPAPDPEAIRSVELEDQDGARLLFQDYFIGQPSIVVFFYTRCENVMKCPVTITKLGRLQRLMHEQQLESRIHTAAITYDPDYDLPPRLEQYRRSFGAQSGPGHRMLRTTGEFTPLRAYFQLGVNYGPTVVNRHRLEAYVLDAEGRIAHRSTRTQWDEREILARAAALQWAGVIQERDAR